MANLEIINAESAKQIAQNNNNNIKQEQEVKNKEIDLSILANIMKVIKIASDKGLYSVEFVDKPYNINSYCGTKQIWCNIYECILDENSQTHSTLIQNGFKIQTKLHPHRRFKKTSIVIVSWGDI